MTHPLPERSLPQMLREQARAQGARIAIRQKDFGIWHPLSWADSVSYTHLTLPTKA